MKIHKDEEKNNKEKEHTQIKEIPNNEKNNTYYKQEDEHNNEMTRIIKRNDSDNGETTYNQKDTPGETEQSTQHTASDTFAQRTL